MEQKQNKNYVMFEFPRINFRVFFSYECSANIQSLLIVSKNVSEVTLQSKHRWVMFHHTILVLKFQLLKVYT